MPKVIFNNRIYDSIEEASRRLQVPAKDLRAKLEKNKKKEAAYAWDHWGFSEEEEYSSDLGSTDDMTDYDMLLDELQIRTLEDIAQEDIEILDAEELKIATELAICLESFMTELEKTIDEEEDIIKTEMERITKEEIEEMLLHFEHVILSQAKFPEEEEKEPAGPWIKHND